MDWNAVAAIAGQEIRINIRNRWVLTFAVVFTSLSLAVCYFGLTTIGAVGVQGFIRTAASLLNLVLYLVPLVALVMATMSFSGERGMTEMLFSQPVSRTDILAGKLSGLFVCIAAATGFGFGTAGILIAAQVGAEGVLQYEVFVGLSLLVALVFLSLGSMIAVFAQNKAKALGVALFVWFFFVLLYDLIAIGATFLLRERTANVFIFVSLFGNPVDLVRTSSLIHLGGFTVLGAGGAALLKFLGGSAWCNILLITSIGFWSVAPMLISSLALHKRDI